MDKGKPNFTRAQVRWAKTHDWFVDGDVYEITVICDVFLYHADGSTTAYKEIESFRDFNKLMAWAGY